ncbi:MAG: NAD-dependent epimerase/dehydratase family protein [Myxococcota bacterium]
MNRVLITGVTGLLGRHTVRALQRRVPDTQLVGLCRRPEPVDGVFQIPGAIERPQAWAGHPKLDGVDTILHLAAKVDHSRGQAQETHRVNVDGTVAIVELAARLGARVVFVSTSGTVGVFDDPDGWADEQSPYVWHRVQHWPYYASKVRAERQARARADELGVPLIIVRPPILLGPDDPTGRSARHVTRILDGRLPALVEGGVHWVDVRAAAEALVTLASDPAPPPVVHLPGTACSLREFADRIARIGGVRAPQWVLPWRVVHTAARVQRRLALPIGIPDPVLVEMGRHWWGLRTRFADRLGWSPPDGDTTLRDTITWLRSRP